MCPNCGYDNRQEKTEGSGPVVLTTCVRCGQVLPEPVRLPPSSDESTGDETRTRRTLLD